MALPKIFAEVGLVIDGFERNAGEVSKRLNAIDRDAQRSLSGFQKIGDRLAEVGKSMSIGITLPLVAAGGAVTKFAADFDLGMRRVTSLLTGVTQKEFQDLSAATLKLSKDIGIDAVKATNALYEAISAGVPKDNAIEFLRVASVAAIAGLTDTNVAVDALTTIIAAYGLEMSEAKNVSDAMFQAVNIGKFTFDQLASVIGPAAAQANNLGISYQELLASTATLSITSGSVGVAVTQIESAMRALLDPSKQMQAALKDIGFESGSAAVKVLGFEGLLQKLREGTHGSAEAFNALFGRIEGANGALGLTGIKAATAAKDLENMRHASDGLGASQAALDQINKSTSRQFEALANNLKTTAIELGVSLLPAVNNLLKSAQPLLQFLSDAVKWFTTLPASVQTTTLAILAAVAAIGPLIAGMGVLISSSTAVIAAMGSIGAAITGIILPQLVAFGAAIANVVYAVATGMTGALVGGEAALLSFAVVLGQVALVAGTAFAAFKIGQVLYENIPAVKAFGDALADLILKIPGVTILIEKLTGASGAAAAASSDLSFATKKLEEGLKAKGIVVDKAGKSATEYAAALREAAKGAGTLGKASDTAQIDKYKKQIQDSQKQAALYAEAQKQLGAGVKSTGAAHVKAKDEVKAHAEEISRNASATKIAVTEYDAAKRALADLQAKILLGRTGTVDWTRELDKLTAEMDSLGRASDDITKIKLPAWAAEIPKITRPNQDLIDALGRLGIKSQTEYKKVADEAAKARDAVLGSGVATDFEKKTAIYKALQAQVEYSKVAGIEITKEQRDALDQMGKDLDNKLPEQKRQWDTFSKSVSTAISNFSQDMVKSLFEGEGSWAEKGMKALKSLGQAVLTSFVEPATAALTEFLNGIIKDLLSGKGLSGVIDGIKDIGKGISGIFGGGASAAGSAAGAAGSAAGAAGSAGSAAASGASGLVGTLTAVGAIGSFASGVISNFQMSAMNKSLGLVEESTRYTAIGVIGPGGLIDTQRTFLPWLEIIGRYLYGVQQPWFVDVSIYLEKVIDTLAGVLDSVVNTTNPLLSDMRGQLDFQNQLALESAGAGPSIQITVTGNTFATSGQMDQFAATVAGHIQRQIGYR